MIADLPFLGVVRGKIRSMVRITEYLLIDSEDQPRPMMLRWTEDTQIVALRGRIVSSRDLHLGQTVSVRIGEYDSMRGWVAERIQILGDGSPKKQKTPVKKGGRHVGISSRR
jgi:hypothetical protein